MVENDSYQRPFIFSLLLHAGLLAFLIINLHDYVSYTTAESQNNPVIQAVVVSEAQVKNQISKIKSEQKASLPAQLKRAKAVEQKQIEAAAAQEEQQRQQAKAAELLAERKQLEASPPKIKELAPSPAQSMEKPTDPPVQKPTVAVPSDEAAKKPLPKKKALDPKLKQAMEQELQKQMAQESAQQELSAATRSTDAEASHVSAAQMQGEVDKYKALIVQAISQHWLIPHDVREDVSCELLIKVSAQGEVLGVEIARSSGDVALDRSARAAVFKAAPLPVPSVAEVFDKFRELRLTVRPENVL